MAFGWYSAPGSPAGETDIDTIKGTVMSTSAKLDRYCVSALERGIRILGLFEQYPAEISGANVARELQLPRATAFRLLRTLEQLGRLERAEGGAYRIGSAAPRRALEFRPSFQVTQATRDAVERLRDRVRCGAQLFVRDGRDAVVLLAAADSEASGTSASVGARRPAYANVLPRILLCELTDAELADLYPELDLPNVGIGSPRSLAELKQFLYEDLARGYTVSDLPLEPGMSGVAAPVRAPDGEFVAAVGITVRTPGLQQAALRDWLVHEVLVTAIDIEDSLRHRRRPGERRSLWSADRAGDRAAPC